MDRNNKKLFNQTIDCSKLNEFNEIINSNELFCRKTINKKINNKNYRYQYFNQLCTCIIRIIETSDYLERFEFSQDNSFGQAFDFYEFMNCLWIIYECSENLFAIFGLKLENYINSIHCFVKSDPLKFKDIIFFKFIRSATSAHPSETTRYSNITNRKLEVYPYALWRKSSIFSNEGGDSDIELLGWSSSTKCRYKRYYLHIEEFYHFINCVTNAIANLIPIANKIIEDNIEKLRCKKLKEVKEFNDYHGYLLYLRNRIKKLMYNGEFPDGGLLLANHLLQNKLITNKFKKYIKVRIEILRKQMLKDITEISYNDIFDELSLYKVIKNSTNEANYISEKFNDYLRHETLNEIKSDLFLPYIKDLDGTPQENARYAVTLLERVYEVLYKEDEVCEMMSYADIYELTLQSIYFLSK